MRAARKTAVLAPVPTSHVLDKKGCIDALAQLVFDGVFTAGQGRYWRAVLERVDVETRIVQPGGESDDLPAELAELADVNRAFHFEFCNVMGPDLKTREPLREAMHLLVRIRVYPNDAYPVDNRPTTSGGSGILLLFSSPAEFDSKARLLGDRSRVKPTRVGSSRLESPQADSSRLNPTPSIFMASQSERDLCDLAVDRSRSLGSISDSSSSSLHLDPRAHAGKNSQASANARTAARATSRETAAPGVVRTSLREGVSRQQSTAEFQGANASREGQKSRGSSARAPTPRASDDEMHVVNAALKCWAWLFKREVEDSFSTVWTATLLTELRRGREGHELLRVIGGARKNPWNGDTTPHRQMIPALFKSDRAIAESSAHCPSGFLTHLCRKYGVRVPPPSEDASTGRPGANDQGSGDGLDSTEHVTHTSVEESIRALNNFDVSYGVQRVPRPGGLKKGSSK